MAKAKRIKGINCDDPAPVGIQQVLVTRFEEMDGFGKAALDWSDPEGVHSMRVASRRLRSAMRDFMPYVRERALTSVLKETKTIAAALGQVRDHDVAIIALEKIEKEAPEEVSATLKQLIDQRKELRNGSRENLVSVLIAGGVKQTKADFLARIQKATASTRSSEPQLTYLKMSSAVIQNRLKELEKLSESLYKPFEIESLHDMRIAAKRLRYAMELFQQCWGSSLLTFAKTAARMQTALGEVHDCDVWIDNVGKQITQARKQKQDNRVAALIWLLSHFVKVRTKHLRRAYDLWRDWEATDVSGQVRQAIR